ncbi:PilW family protein [Cryobacterium sp. W22_MBD10_FK3]|uniref:PilW family protein n=1 Tax=Cryobacterium sp. W22_MBD10_FK3 TaxID=3240273 RepID=UPI003F8E69AE
MRMFWSRETKRDVKGESGFTLVELLIYSAMATVILVIISSFLINAVRGERDVRSVAEATTLGQLLSNSVQKGVRNASGLQLTNGVDGSILLIARTANSAVPLTWSCQAWFFDPIDGAVYTTKHADTAPISVPSGGPQGSWTVLGNGISAVAGAAVFATRPNGIDMDFYVAAGDNRDPVHLQTSAIQRNPESVGTPCF